ncbi:MAG TPA: MauE/DoxX family redox-associated membrane protein [Ktedonobacterales bacterium]|nr:MauE/DoxX family redox-associated membrane protein [Ktedonobacterales bacterium]
MTIVYLRVFIRLFLGLLLISTGVAKLPHLAEFTQSIQDYKLIPPTIDARLHLTAIAARGISIVELLCGLGLIAGSWLGFIVSVSVLLLLVFSFALTFNLLRGRRDLSCHCGGMLGDHLISWWLVARNSLVVLALLMLVVTPGDPFTVKSFFQASASLEGWVDVALPAALLAVLALAALSLANVARVLRQL